MEGGSQVTAPTAAFLAGTTRLLDPSPAPLAEALAAFAGRQFRRAALAASSYHKLHPWHRASVLLEPDLGRLAAQRRRH